MTIHQIAAQIPEAERAALVDHLSKDRHQGPGLARWIAENDAPVSKYVVRTLADLGQVPTGFETIGNVKAINRCRRERFPVQSAFAVFEEAAVHGLDKKGDLISLYEMLRLLETGHAPGKITALGKPDRFFLADGNQSAIALYEYTHRQQPRSLAVPLYLIEGAMPE